MKRSTYVIVICGALGVLVAKVLIQYLDRGSLDWLPLMMGLGFMIVSVVSLRVRASASVWRLLDERQLLLPILAGSLGTALPALTIGSDELMPLVHLLSDPEELVR